MSLLQQVYSSLAPPSVEFVEKVPEHKCWYCKKNYQHIWRMGKETSYRVPKTRRIAYQLNDGKFLLCQWACPYSGEIMNCGMDVTNMAAAELNFKVDGEPIKQIMKIVVFKQGITVQNLKIHDTQDFNWHDEEVVTSAKVLEGEFADFDSLFSDDFSCSS